MYSSFPEADVIAEITNASGTEHGERSTDSPPCTQQNSVMSARGEAAAGREAEPCMGGEEEEEEVVEESGGEAVRLGLYLRRGGVHHYSERPFDVEAGWISESRRAALLIKTLTMQPELPRRNAAFEESLNAPFRTGCPQITADITMTDSEASVAESVVFF